MTDLLADDFATAYEDAFSRLRTEVETACREDREGPVRVALGVRAAFAFATARPRAARLLTYEALVRGEDGQAHYRRMVAHFAALLGSARDPATVDGGEEPAVADSAIVGGVALLVGRRLAHGRGDELAAMATEAAELVLTPWIGADRARRMAREHC